MGKGVPSNPCDSVGDLLNKKDWHFILRQAAHKTQRGERESPRGSAKPAHFIALFLIIAHFRPKCNGNIKYFH